MKLTQKKILALVVDDSEEDSDDEKDELGLFIEKYRKFIKMRKLKGQTRNQPTT